MKTWQRRDKYHLERAQLKGVNQLAEFLVAELEQYQLRADFSECDKESWGHGYRTAMRMVAECIPYLPGSGLLTVGRDFTEQPTCLREKGEKVTYHVYHVST